MIKPLKGYPTSNSITYDHHTLTQPGGISQWFSDANSQLPFHGLFFFFFLMHVL